MVLSTFKNYSKLQVIQNFLMQAAQLLSVSDPMVVYQQEQANIELIR